MAQRPHRYLHLHSSFDAGGKELRAVRLMNAFRDNAEHVVVSAQQGAYGACVALDKAIRVDFPEQFPSLNGSPTWQRLRALAKAMRGYDLILTYNWGAMNAVLAHRLFFRSFGLPPLVHHEDGFNQDEVTSRKVTRNWFRRLSLFAARAVVVPSQRLDVIARKEWRQHPSKVHRIPNGIDTQACALPAEANAVPIQRSAGEKWVGTLAGLRAVKNLPRLVRAFSHLPQEWRLVIVGEGSERQTIMAEAERLGIGHRVSMPGFLPQPERVVGSFDIFALSSDSEQFPISVVEAMAAGVPVVSPRVGDVADMVSVKNRDWIVPAGDEEALANALKDMAHCADRRASIGEANQIKAHSEYDEARMIERYRCLYARVIGQTVLM